MTYTVYFWTGKRWEKCRPVADALIASNEVHRFNSLGKVAHYEKTDLLSRVGLPDDAPPESQLRFAAEVKAAFKETRQ